MTVDKEELYELLWSFSYLSVHRYGGSPSAEVLIVLTIMLLDSTGQQLTMSELAQITGLPKSNVSRYVGVQLKVGHLEERIDPRDRRRRVLHPTEAGREEQRWLLDSVIRLSKLKNGSESKVDEPVDMAELLDRIARHYRDDASSRSHAS